MIFADFIGGFYGRYNRGQGRRGTRGETKFLDTVTNASTLSPSGTVTEGSFNLIPQGISESERIGRKCTVVSISGRQTVRLPSGNAINGSNVWRLWLVQDRQANGAVPTYGDVMQQSTSNTFRNMENIARFKILWTKTMAIDALSLAIDAADAQHTGERHQVVDFHVRCNIPIDFDNTAATGAITTIRSNNIFMIASTRATDTAPVLSGTYRLRFTDK